MTELPYVSVIIVNYNGAVYLPACLDALSTQTYPRDKYEVIVSDNDSSDASLEILKRDYPWVRTLKNGENLGFAAGNNVAISAARGEYFVLLNNDTAAEAEWLEQMTQSALHRQDAGIVTGHLRLFYDQITLRIHCDTFFPPNDGRELGVQIYAVGSSVQRGVVQYLNGFYGWEIDSLGRKFRWTKGDAEIGVPVPMAQEEFSVIVRIAAPGSADHSTRCKFVYGDSVVEEYTLHGDEIKECPVRIPKWIRAQAVPLEQNTGSMVYRNGYGRDRGTFVKNNELFFEEDRGQYCQAEEVFAGCGASLLIKRELIEQIGGFDDDFFMYYEDIDLCWRARLRGWKIYYAPNALVRHIHCGTTAEWSSNFLYLTERNRLALILKNGGFLQVIQVWGAFAKSMLATALKAFWNLFLRRPSGRQLAGHFRVQIKIAAALLAWQPSLWKKRVKIQSNKVIAPREIETWLFRE